MRALELIRAVAFAAAFAAASPCAAEPQVAARLYAAGNYMAAAEAAEAQDSPASLAFAARALIAECLSSPSHSDINALLNRAESAAREALERDPSSVDARLQLALTLGVRGRRASIAEAIRHGYARQGRDLIEEALERDPNEPWAHALMGGWHLEVLRRGGRAGALAYGARLNTGIAEFERARTLAPNDPIITLHYAVALIELDSERYADRAGVLLDAAADMPARDALERHARHEARRLSRVLEREGPAAATRAVRMAAL